MDFSLSIGIDSYIHLANTPFAENDAKVFHETMKDVFNIQNPILILGNKATFTNIGFHFDKIVSKLDKKERLFYFSLAMGLITREIRI